MRAADLRQSFEGAFVDPGDRYRCFIFEGSLFAALAASLPEAAAVAAPEALAAGAGGLASTVLPEVAVTAAAPGLLTAGEAAGAVGAGVGAGAAGEALTTGAGGFGPTSLDTAVGTGGTGTGVPTPLTTPSPTTGAAAPGAMTVHPLSSTAVPAGGAGVGGPVSGAAPLPADVPISPTGTGSGLDAAFTAKDVPVADLTGDAASGTTSTGGSTLGTGLNNAIKGATGGFLDKGDLGTALAAGGLGMNLMNRNQPIPGQKQVSQAANNLTATAAGQAALGTNLESFLTSGTLPPGIDAGLRSATQAAHATIRSQYAARGESGSSAEAQDIQAASDRALAAGQDVAMKLLQQGSTMVGQAANTEGLAAQLYGTIINDALTRDNALGAAIGNFASSLAGGGGNNTITVKAA